MRRSLRVPLTLLLGLPLLVLLGLAGALVWANGESGRAALARLAGEAVPGLAIEGLRGPLPGRIGVARLVMSDAAGPWLELEDAEIVLDLPALVRREARVRAVTARRLVLLRLPPGDGTPSPPPDPDAPLLPALPDLPLAFSLDRLAVDRIELGAAVLGTPAVLALDGEAALSGGRLTARLAARRLDAPAEARLALDLAPGADRLTAQLDATEPPGGLLAGLLGQPERATRAHLTLDGPATGARLDLSAALGEDITLAAEGTVRAAPDGAAGGALTIRLAAAPLLPPEARGAAMPATLAVDGAIDAARRLTLRRLAIEAPAGRVEAEGRADLAAETLDVTLRAAIADSARLGALLPPVAQWEGIAATLHATGPMRAPRIEAEATPRGLATDTPALQAALGATPRLTLDATLPDRVASLVLDGAAAQVAASGTVGATLDARLTARVADLAPILPGLAGGLMLEARATGPRTDPTVALTARGERVERQGQVLEAPDLSLTVATPLSAPRAEGRLSATYAGLPVTLDLRALPDGARVRVERLAAAFGPARLTAQGTFDPAATVFTGEARLDASDLAPFSALAGTPLAGRLALRATLDARDGQQGFDATLDAPGASFGGTPVAGTLRAEGTPASLDATLDARARDARLSARARLAQDGADRRIDIAELLLRQGAESIRLAAPARVTLGADGSVTLAGLTLAAGRGGSLRAEGRWGPERADLRLALSALPAAAVAAFAAPGLAVEGTLGAEAQVTGPVADPAARFRLEGTNLRLADPAARGLPAARLLVEGSAGARAAEARLEASAGTALRATGTLRLPGGFEPRAALAARLDASADVAALAGPLLAAGAQRVAGRVTLQAEAGGTLGAPRLGGRATLTDGAFRDLAQGVTLTGIAARLSAADDRIAIDRFEAHTPGNGTISATGMLSPLAAGLPVEVTVTARNARPLRSDIVAAAFDAELRLAGQLLAQSRLSGRVDLRRVDVTVPERLPPGVQRLEGVRERGRRPAGTPPLAPPPAPGAAAGPDIALEVEVKAPRAVFVRGRGIDAEFGGTLAVAGTAAAPLVSGGFMLRRGDISIFDRRIAFRRGNIAFDTGTLVPTLDFLATSNAREVTANVTVTGRANDPKIEFSSSPELPQDEILARLLFDRRASELSPFQLAQLAQALAGAAGLETPGAGGVLDRIRRALALDRLAVGEERDRTTGRSQGATLETGRYVADGVYLGVRQSGEGGPPRVGAQVDILPRVRVEAETGGNSAGGDRVGLSFEYEY